MSRVGLRTILAVSTLGFAACMMSWIVLVDAGPILVTRFAAGALFGGIFFAFVMTMSRLLPARLQATGQTLFQACCFGVAAVLANVVGGILYAIAGPLGVFGAGGVCAIAGALVGFAVLPARDEPRTVWAAEPVEAAEAAEAAAEVEVPAG